VTTGVDKVRNLTIAGLIARERQQARRRFAVQPRILRDSHPERAYGSIASEDRVIAACGSGLSGCCGKHSLRDQISRKQRTRLCAARGNEVGFRGMEWAGRHIESVAQIAAECLMLKSCCGMNVPAASL